MTAPRPFGVTNIKANNKRRSQVVGERKCSGQTTQSRPFEVASELPNTRRLFRLGP
jgi:hypothetical protein